MIPLTLLGISGALRKDSSNTKLVHAAEKLFKPARFEFADLRLPLYDGDVEIADGIPATVQRLHAQIAEADAVVISTPEYNKAISGVLKNALDWVSRMEGNPWAGKPVAVMSAAGGRAGGEVAQYTLRHCLTPFAPDLVLGNAVMLADSRKQFDEDGNLINEITEKSLTRLMEALRKRAGG
tara:strand:- start:99 stop:641 length:543 start_codon:yes stop_codon:yes gene_type:complete